VATDAAGNPSAAATRTIAIDTTAPAAPVINLVAGDDTVNLGEQTAGVTVSGTAEANVALKVYWNSAVKSITAASDGTWSANFSPAEVPADGASTVVAIAQDAAGNASAAGTRAVTINTPGRSDNTAPNAPEVDAIASNDIINAVEKAAGVVVSGMAESNATVIATWGTAIKTVQADITGAWSASFTSGELPADGTSNISVTARDIANNTSAAGTRSVSIDSAAPTAPVISAVATDNTVNAEEKAAGVLVSGSAEANASVVVTWGTSSQNVTADGSGNWSSTFASADVPASGSISAVATDAAGNTGAAGTRTVSIDTATPDAPTISMVSGNDIVNAAEKLAGVAVSGTAEAGSSVAVTWGDTTQTVTATGGTWSSTFASSTIPDGGNITATATDAAGNASVAVMRAVNIDATAPTVPVIHTVAGNDIVNATEKAAGVVVSGTTESNATVLATWGTAVKTVQADITGAWSASFAASEVPTDSNSSISAIASDAAGNASSAGIRSVSIDTAAPTAPVIHTVATDNIVNAAEYAAGVVVSGTAEANASIAVVWGANPARTVSADGSGNWSSTFASADIPASGSISAVSTDAAGNASAAATRSVSVDTAAPATPVIRTVATDNTVNAAEYAAGVVVSGTAEANASVSVAWGSKPALTVIADSNGNWTRSFTSTDIPASGNISAIATDVAGNASTTATRVVSVDAVAPAAPVINIVAFDDNVNVAEKTAGVVVSGSAEISSTIDLTWGATAKSVVVGSTGNWSATFSAAEMPASGSTTISASVTDAAGNAGAASATRAVTVDRSAVNRDVSAMDAATLLATGADINVDSITLASSQVLNLTASQYTANSVALGKITNPITDYAINIVSGVATQSDALSLGANANVDSITLSSGQTLSLSQTLYNTNAVALGKISTLPADYTLNVTGVNGSDALAIAAHSNVDHVTLVAGHTFALSPAAFNSASASFDKFTNPTTDYSVTLDLAASTDSADIAAVIAGGNPNGYIDTLNLADNAVTLTDAQASSLVSEGVAFHVSDSAVDVALSDPSTAVGTHLQTSLSDLQKLGVDVVNVALSSGAGMVDIAAGTGAIDFAHLPTVNAAAGVVVGLEVNNAGFSSLVSGHAVDLHNAGFDAVTLTEGSLTIDSAQLDVLHAGGLVLDTRNTITMQVASAGEASVISNLVSAIDAHTYGHDIDVIDMGDNSVALTDHQASSLVTAGVSFALDDSAVAVSLSDPSTAVGTHLQTSLSDLQKLGVDVVNVAMVSAAGMVGIEAGSGAVDFATLPTVNAAAGVTVGLEVSDTAFTALNLPTHAAELHTAGFDAIMAADHTLTVDSAQLNAVHGAGMVFDARDTITMQVSSANEGVAISTLVSAIDDQTYRHDLDVIDLTDNAVTLTDAQAATLVTAGLHFAADDTGVALQAVGTHLQTSMHELAALGVDMVYSDSSAGDKLVIDLGTGSALTANGLPGFYAHANVTIVANDNQLGELASVGQFAGWANSHVDTLAVVLHDSLGTGAELSGLGVLDPALHGVGYTGNIELDVAFADSAVTLGMLLDAADGSADPLMTLSGAGLVSALQAAGIITHIDAITQFVVADTDLAPLMAANLLSAHAAADVTVANSDGTLSTSLAQLAAIGADHVQTLGGSTLALDAGLHSTSQADVTAELNQLLTAFEAASGGGVAIKSVFDTADTVELKVAATFATGFHLDASLLHNLQLLGIDDVLDETGNSIK
jgi:hypothetical protein